MESREEHRKTCDARRLIKYQKKGHKLSTHEPELIETYREKERIRQQRFRKCRKLMYPFPKKRGRKPKAKSDKIDETMLAETDSLHSPSRIARRYREEVPHQGVASVSAVDILINGYRGICLVPIDSRFLAAPVSSEDMINSQPHHGDDSSRTPCVSTLLEPVPADGLIPELRRSMSRQHNVSSPCNDPTTSAASLSVSDVYSLAASGSSPTPSCTSSSSIGSSSLLTVSSSQSPESTSFTPQIETSEEYQVELSQHACAAATADYVPNLYMGFLQDGERNVSSTSSENKPHVIAPHSRSPKVDHAVLSHSIWTSSEIVQTAPNSLNLQQCELLPRHIRQLRGLLQAWSIEDKDRAFDEMVAFVNRVVEEVVDEVRQQTMSSCAITMNNDDNVSLKQMPISSYGEIHDILYEFTNFEQRVEHTY